MNVYLALFRGINVGTSTRIPMRALIEIFERCGCVSVRSYIQSGNVVFASESDGVLMLMEGIEREILEQFGVRTWITFRDRDEMRAIVACNPFEELEAAPTSVAVAFHRAAEPIPAFQFLGDPSSIPDRVERRGRETWLYLPDGFSKSRLLPKFFAKDLGETTTRNWRTVTKVLAMLDELD